jgi:hypothetical protein
VQRDVADVVGDRGRDQVEPGQRFSSHSRITPAASRRS